MTTGKPGVATYLDRSEIPDHQSRALRRWWSAFTALLVAAIFVEAAFAGAMLSGSGWARTAHVATAGMLIVSTTAAGLVCVFTLRRIQHGLKLGFILLALATVIFLQAAVGALSARGANLLWVHVPLGVALVGFAAQAVADARRLQPSSRP